MLGRQRFRLRLRRLLVAEIQVAQVRIAQQDHSGAQGREEAASGDGQTRAGAMVAIYPLDDAAHRGKAHDNEAEEAHEVALAVHPAH